MNKAVAIRHLMTTPVRTVQFDAHVSEVHALLRDASFHHVPVCKGDVLVGILGVVDIARVSLEAYVADEGTVDAHLDAAFCIEQVMTPEPRTLRPSDTLIHAIELFADGGFHALPVVDDAGKVLGMVTTTDVLRFLHASL